jgi:signal transduction histidine kinase
MRRRLILGAAYLLLVVIVGLAVPFGATLRHRLIDELGGRVEREAFAVGAAAEDSMERGRIGALQPLAAGVSRRIGGRVLITDAVGILLADSLQAPGPNPPSYATRPEIAAALRGSPNWEVRHSVTLGQDLLVSAVPVRNAGGILAVVRISYPMSDVAESIHRAWWFLAVVGLVTLAIGLALAAWLARWLTRPLARAAAVTRSIADGDLDARVPETGPPEVKELARDMNVMTEHLGELVRANREFAANASHQLRTPLTALRLSLEEAVDGPDPRGEARAALADADRLEAIVGSLLALGAERERGTDRVDVAKAAGEIAARHTSKPGTMAAPAPAVTVTVTGNDFAMADPERLRQVLGNLVDNALRFARQAVRIDIVARGDRLVVRVDDDGPGIAPEERARVFHRFSRGREPRGSGSGLGLAVARELARVDGASITVGESDLGGARFEVTYAAARPSGVPALTGTR